MRVDEPLSELGYTVAPMETGAELVVGRALVVVVDDRTAHGDEDHSGPLVTELLTEAGFVVDGVVGVVVVPALVVVPPSPEPPEPPEAAAGPAATAKNRMEVAASRRQPVTAFEYDKPTLSLSCAYGVSCRARAERVCATPRSMWRFAPRAAIATQQLGSPAPIRLGESDSAGCAGGQHNSTSTQKASDSLNFRSLALFHVIGSYPGNLKR